VRIKVCSLVRTLRGVGAFDDEPVLLAPGDIDIDNLLPGAKDEAAASKLGNGFIYRKTLCPDFAGVHSSFLPRADIDINARLSHFAIPDEALSLRQAELGCDFDFAHHSSELTKQRASH